MRFFDHLKAKKGLSQADQRWNRMWELWARGEAASPYAELMCYVSEVHNGGHGQYFCNMAQQGDLQRNVALLCQILPPVLRDNLREAFSAKEGPLEEYDRVFYQQEPLITGLLRAYSGHFRPADVTIYSFISIVVRNLYGI